MSTLTHLVFTNNGLVTALFCYKEKGIIADRSKIHLDVYYVFKRVCFWKQRMHQRSETRVCIYSGPD